MPPPPPPSRLLSRGAGLFTSAPRLSSCTAAPTTAQPAATLRQLSTTAGLAYKQRLARHTRDFPIPSPTAQHPEIPPYPYGPRATYKQSNKGLYGSASIRFGNNVSRKWDVKTRRKWRPNVQSKRLWSAALGQMVRTRITTRVLRTVDKVGGLDNYLLGTKTQRIKDLGPWGWRLRWRIMQTNVVRDMFAAQRAALGLEPASAGDEALPEGETVESLMRQTDEMLRTDSEFEIGSEDAEPGLEDAQALPNDFMVEEKRPSRSEAKNL